MDKVLLPLSSEAISEIMQQVAMRGQEDRITTYNGAAAVDLSGVVVVDMPTKMMEEQHD